MIKKLFSRALLSMVMDKDARRTLDAMGSDDATPTPSKKAKGKKAKSKPARPPNDDMLDDLPATLIQQAVDEARREAALPPEGGNTDGPGGPVSAERQKLIQQAMAVHKKQSKLLDELPPEEREKLTVMAMHAFGDARTEQKKKKKKKG